jgi:hypothetical protein
MGSERLDASLPNLPAVFLLAAALALPAAAQAAVGVSEIAGKDGSGSVTIFYSSSGEARPLKRGPFTLNFASQGAPLRGNGRGRPRGSGPCARPRTCRTTRPASTARCSPR